MKLRRMFFLLVLLLGQIGSVSTDAWMIWNHLRDFHGVEHVCRHECDVCLAHHSSSVRCNCLSDHNEADRQLYVCSNGDASHRQHHAPVAVLPPFRSQLSSFGGSTALLPLSFSRRKTLFSFKETVNFTAFSPYILTEPPETAAKKKLMLRRGGGIRFPAP